jgi:spermidine synthase
MTDTPAMLAITNPFSADCGLLRLLEPADADRAALSERLRSGTYDKPFIAEDGETRALYFSWAYVQSRMRIEEPVALELCYTRKMMSFLLFHTNPRALLLLGLGGGSLAKYCWRFGIILPSPATTAAFGSSRARPGRSSPRVAISTTSS